MEQKPRLRENFFLYPQPSDITGNTVLFADFSTLWHGFFFALFISARCGFSGKGVPMATGPSWSGLPWPLSGGILRHGTRAGSGYLYRFSQIRDELLFVFFGGWVYVHNIEGRPITHEPRRASEEPVRRRAVDFGTRRIDFRLERGKETRGMALEWNGYGMVKDHFLFFKLDGQAFLAHRGFLGKRRVDGNQTILLWHGSPSKQRHICNMRPGLEALVTFAAAHKSPTNLTTKPVACIFEKT